MKDQIMEVMKRIHDQNDDKEKDHFNDLRKFSQELTKEVVELVLDTLNDRCIDDTHDDGETINLAAVQDHIKDLKANWQVLAGDSLKCEDAQEVVESVLNDIDEELDDIYSIVENYEDQINGHITDFTNLAYDLERYGTQEEKDKFIEQIASVNDNALDLPTK